MYLVWCKNKALEKSALNLSFSALKNTIFFVLLNFFRTLSSSFTSLSHYFFLFLSLLLFLSFICRDISGHPASFPFPFQFAVLYCIFLLSPSFLSHPFCFSFLICFSVPFFYLLLICPSFRSLSPSFLAF